ncbi:hypothetical protein [Halorhodospira halophila]|uniref:Uncharacterized protein n=1 Tax=Halorhodospira halophila (strain DSM 244 / SL1) TaxID=349124 RepID=A1WW53_HALHL|nr:hypothetical protein [Halorhodospira halophila]ABM61915.1 hypothetical protein Hhal_1139 [Halorhodospira halophila SL1]
MRLYLYLVVGLMILMLVWTFFLWDPEEMIPPATEREAPVHPEEQQE